MKSPGAEDQPHYTQLVSSGPSPLDRFQAPVRAWFEASLGAPTDVQRLGWPPILAGENTLLLAPTGTGKTLAAFLVALQHSMFSAEPPRGERLRVIYVSPLKALGVDIERNLRAPVAGILVRARELGVACRQPEVWVRSGDTPARERARFARAPSDILITTPESLYLILTSAARRTLAYVDTLIIDEIHALVSGKRGVHLCLSVERLEALRVSPRPLQRIGLSATQKPLHEVARFLGGGEVRGEDLTWTPRPVTVVDVGSTKSYDVSVELPAREAAPSRGAPAGSGIDRSIWPALHGRLWELVRCHRSTLVFVNNRRLTERVAAALNDLAGAELALAHHGSLAKERRREVEERLKRGELRAVVATASLELGIDMGAIDLVVQIEAPPSVAAGLQRVGRAGHAVTAVSRGVFLPKYRADLLACAAVTPRMLAGEVEETPYPRHPLDVLAQQIVAMVSIEPWPVQALFDLVRRAAPFADLPSSAFVGVLDLLSGHYPSDEFSTLVPRITWDRTGGWLRARRGSRQIAIVNGGTIPDRGLYGVFLAGSDTERTVRVGELDEEMVFESRPGDVFLLGASSWRIEEITHDRVIVSPAPGQPGKMPFWHGDRPGRAFALGAAIGALARELSEAPEQAALERLTERHGLQPAASEQLLDYLTEQRTQAGVVPTDRVLLVECFADELGDQRISILSPFGSRVHAPWTLAVAARLGERMGIEVDAIWSDDGMVFRLPQGTGLPSVELLAPARDEIRDLVTRAVAHHPLFAARFRENAARALLLPRRRPGVRSPLWAQRKRARDLLGVAARYPSFPLLLETYREVLRDLFDLPALERILGQIEGGQIALRVVESLRPSPFTASLLFSYVANFMYEGDAPLAERRAHALSIDHRQLRELLGESDARSLLDPGSIQPVERRLQRLAAPDDSMRGVRDPDGLHDLLLDIGDLSLAELRARCLHPASAADWLEELGAQGRIFRFTLGEDERFAAEEDAARLRDAIGIMLPRGLPPALLDPPLDPLGDIVARYARTHGPFVAASVARRFALGVDQVTGTLTRLADAGRMVRGEFLPGSSGQEWCDQGVLELIRRRTLAKLRREVEPVGPEALGRLLIDWHGIDRPRSDPEALSRAVEQLEGAGLPFSDLLADILPARIAGFSPSELDSMCARGELIWRGIEPLGSSDGRIALYFTDGYSRLAPPVEPAPGALAGALRELLGTRGALFWNDLVEATGAFPPELLTALWALVWAGEVSNDTLAPLVSRLAPEQTSRPWGRRSPASRRAGPPGSEGRWSLLPRIRLDRAPSETERRVALANLLLGRYGIVAREVLRAEAGIQSFSLLYPVYRSLEERGRLRRGYFVNGLGGAQFALPAAVERLRALRERPAKSSTIVLAAADPANPYGSVFDWPPGEPRPQRAAGAHVVLKDGALIGYLGRSDRRLQTFLPEGEAERVHAARAMAQALAGWVEGTRRRALFIATIDGEPQSPSVASEALIQVGFVPTSRGYLKRMKGRSDPRRKGH